MVASPFTTKWHADQIRDASDQIRLPHPRGPDENDVLLGVIRCFLPLKRQPYLMVMIAQRHAEDLFCLFLFDHVTVKVSLNIARLVIKFELRTCRFWTI